MRETEKRMGKRSGSSKRRKRGRRKSKAQRIKGTVK